MNTKNQNTHFSFLDDDASPIHIQEVETESGIVNYTLKYPSRDYSSRYYSMTVRVFNKWAFGRRQEIAYDNIRYRITKQLNGEMKVTQSSRTIVEAEKGAIISTNTSTKVEINLYDPHCKL